MHLSLPPWHITYISLTLLLYGAADLDKNDWPAWRSASGIFEWRLPSLHGEIGTSRPVAAGSLLPLMK